MTTGPGLCHYPATHFMLIRYPTSPADIWPVFLCTGCAREVPLAEPLDQVAAAELADRREQHALAMAGKPYRRPVALRLHGAGATDQRRAKMTGDRRSDRYRQDPTAEASQDAEAMYAAADRLDAQSGPRGLWVDESVALPIRQALYAGSRELANGRALARPLWTALRTLADALQADPAAPGR
jgi:hypothetical protein